MPDLLRTREFGDWLGSVSLLECGLGSTPDVTSKSLAFLAVAPDLDALLVLADPTDRQVYQHDVLAAIDQCLDEMGLSHPGGLDWAWIALRTTFVPANSISEELEKNRLRFDLQTRYTDLFPHTSRFIAAQADLIEGADPVLTAKSIRTEVERGLPQFSSDFLARFDAGPCAWVASALPL